MKKLEVKKNGTLIEVTDLYDQLYTDAWDGSREVYLLYDTLYVYVKRKNSFSYNGPKKNSRVLENVKNGLKNMSWRFWERELTRKGYEKLCEACGVIPEKE